MKYLIAAILLAASSSLLAQSAVAKVPPMDKSPMDMSYYPADYPILKIQNKVTAPLVMRVVYSRPQTNGRKIFGSLQEYGEVWRLGANEATEIEFFREVKINNTKIKKGRYTIYAIPFVEKWTFIVNKETDIWGSFQYDKAKDVVRVDLPVKNSGLTEDLSIVFEKTSTGANMNMYWDDVKVTLPVVF